MSCIVRGNQNNAYFIIQTLTLKPIRRLETVQRPGVPSQKLASLGIMGEELRAIRKPLDTKLP